MRKVWTFFYGSFMNRDVLAKAGVHPSGSQVARLDGWQLTNSTRRTGLASAPIFRRR